MPNYFNVRPNLEPFFDSTARFLALLGGVGCVGGETLIGGASVASLTTKEAPFPVPTMWGWSVAAAAFPKGFARLYHVVSDADPAGVWATAEHLFLTPDGWTPLGELIERHRQPFSLACCESVHGPTETGRGKGFLESCLDSRRLSDEQSTPLALDALSKWIQLHKNDDDTRAAYFLADLLSKSCFENLVCCSQSCSDVEEPPSSGVFDESLRRLLHSLFQVLQSNGLQDILGRFFPSEAESLASYLNGMGCYAPSECAVLPHETLHTLKELCTKHDALASFARHGLPTSLEFLWAYVSLSVLGNISAYPNYITRWGKGQVVAERDDVFYDVYVPGVASYIAGGMVHHNSGKTASGAVLAVKKINEGKDGIIVAPDFPQLSRSTWPEFTKWAPMSRCTNAHLDHPFTAKKQLLFNVRGKTVKVYYGGIEDEEGWAGPNVNWAWFDEGARKRTKRAFEVLSARIRVGERPQLFITTTPSGVHHWLYDIFVKQDFPEPVMKALREAGYTGNLAEYIHVKTEENKENLDPFYYLSLSMMYTGKAKQQELEGQFITLEGMVWENLDVSEGGRNCTVEADYTPGVPVEWWVDDGFTEGHPRVFLLAQVVPPYINVFDEHIALGQLSEDSIRDVLEKGYPKPSVAYVDSSAAELRSRIWLADIDTVSATHPVEEGIKRTATWICDANNVGHLRFHPRCKFSVKQMPNYFRDPDTGRPIKDSDDVSDAVRYGLWTKDRETIWSSETPNYSRLLMDRRGVEAEVRAQQQEEEEFERETDPLEYRTPAGIITPEGLMRQYQRQIAGSKRGYGRGLDRKPTIEELMQMMEGYR